MWRWLKGKAPSTPGEMKKSVSIDVSGPEFFDLYPTKEDFAGRLRDCGFFRHEEIDWMAETIHQQIIAGGSYKAAHTAIVRAGTQMTEDEIKVIGLHKRTKIGDRFVAAVSVTQIKPAIDQLFLLIQHATSKSNKLHNLRRMEEAGITQVEFSSPKDERSTPLEREMEGKVITIGEAKELTVSRSDEISRSVLMGIVKF